MSKLALITGVDKFLKKAGLTRLDIFWPMRSKSYTRRNIVQVGADALEVRTALERLQTLVPAKAKRPKKAKSLDASPHRSVPTCGTSRRRRCSSACIPNDLLRPDDWPRRVAATSAIPTRLRCPPSSRLAGRTFRRSHSRSRTFRARLIPSYYVEKIPPVRRDSFPGTRLPRESARHAVEGGLVGGLGVEPRASGPTTWTVMADPR
jgi:hypothetical protein